MVGQARAANLAVTSVFPKRMDQFNAKAVQHPKDADFGQQLVDSVAVSSNKQ